MEQEVVKYIHDASKYGLGEDEIKRHLKDAGWSDQIIAKSYEYIAREKQVLPVSSTPKQETGQHQELKDENPVLVQTKSSVPVNPNEQNDLSVLGAKPKRKLFLPIILALTFILIGLGLVIWVFVLGKPVFGFDLSQKIWVKALETELDLKVNRNFKVSYSDPGQFDFNREKLANIVDEETIVQLEQSLPVVGEFIHDGISLKQFNTSGDFGGFMNLEDMKNPKIQGHFYGNLEFNSKNYEGKLDVRFSDLVLYFKYAFNPVLGQVIEKIISDENGQNTINQWRDKWIKYQIDSIDPEYLSNEFRTIQPGGDNHDKFVELLKRHRLFDIKRLVNVSKVNGVYTAKYQLSFNKTQFRAMILESLDDYNQKAPEKDKFSDSDKEQMTKVLDALLSQWEVKEFSSWVELTNGRIVKLAVRTNAVSITKTLDELASGLLPELSTAAQASKGIAKARGRDAKRYADARQIMNALELFYDDNGGYPASDQGKPKELEPFYINPMPETVTPPDGKCNDFFNTLWYAPKGDPYTVSGSSGVKTVYPDYNLSFCIGDKVADLSPGVIVINREGIKNLEGCPEGKVCYKDNSEGIEALSDQEITQKIVETIKKLPFDADFNFEYELLDQGKVSQVEIPNDATDIKNIVP